MLPYYALSKSILLNQSWAFWGRWKRSRFWMWGLREHGPTVG